LVFFANLLYANPIDSVGTERKNGKVCILHKIVVGETLRQVAKKYKTTIANISLYNANLDSNFVKIGQIIYIPISNSTNISSNSSNQIPKITQHKHTVKSGETLTKIATLYKIEIDSLLFWNKLGKNTILQLGQTLLVGMAATKNIVTDQMVLNRDKTKTIHEVGKGERISSNSTTKFALHHTFPVGTIVLLVNPTNRIASKVKIIGKIPDIDRNKDIVIKISDAVCKELFIVNDVFAIEVICEKIDK
jgi:LysM repeat protein